MINETRARRDRLVTLFVVFLLAATAMFVIGVAVERSRGHHETVAGSRTIEAPSSQPSVSTGGEEGNEAGEGEEGHGSGEGGQDREGAVQHGAGSDESVFGIDPESTPAVTTVVVLSLALVAVVWWWPIGVVLLAAGLFCVATVGFDVREAVLQSNEGRTGVTVLAITVAVLHAAAAASAFAAVTQHGRAGLMRREE